MRELFLTLFYSGKSSVAPGTMGSLVALIIGLPILYFSSETIFLFAIFIGIIAIKQIDIYEKNGGIHDDKSIVIDELVGLWLAMGMVGFSLSGIIMAFLFFRLYDIWKPSIIGKIDREIKGGLGVVGDDALAGLLAGLSVLIILRILSFFQISPNWGLFQSFAQ
ncbi:hypothetical protein BKH41_04600 [Helicobacter sp. 12S02232-10]|uniref:phosphatidylglycerophosphatase A family protein n=1 Tax=Helicobacter sp. 12S02232-10 TaxID=1476197 RepID=UPI000BA5AF7D|nr:phosphatidylglycerophosphatase A [Helicobacter sp. 12S02232-10]PAF48910.1 hypothetical protein BKH41_04600 [Helicobacter sp. 12S02232-10]